MSASARSPLPSLRGLIELERVSKLYPARVDELVYPEGMNLFPSSWIFAWCRITNRCCKTPDKNLELMMNLEGATVLHYAAMRNDIRAAETLLHRGARVNVINADGRTPLMLAAMFGHREIAVLLVSWRARASVTDAWGLDAAAWANLRGYTTIGEVLASVSVAPRQPSSPPPQPPSSPPSQPEQSQRPAPKPSPPPTSSHSAQRQPALPTPPSPPSNTPSNGSGGSTSAHHGGAHVGPAAPRSGRPLSPVNVNNSQSISAVATIPLMMAVQSLQSNRFSGQIPEPGLIPSREPFSPPPRPVYPLSPQQQRVARAREAASIRGRLHPSKEPRMEAPPSQNGSRLQPCLNGVLTWMAPEITPEITPEIQSQEEAIPDLDTGGAPLTEAMPGGGYGGGGPCSSCRSRPKSVTDFGNFAGFADTYVGYGGFISGRSVRPPSAPFASASAPTTRSQSPITRSKSPATRSKSPTRSSLEGTTALVTTLAKSAESPVGDCELVVGRVTDEATISNAQSAQRRNWVVSARRWVQEKPPHSLSPDERHDEHLFAQERLYVVPPYWQRGGGGK